jgi:polysaccharide deacetylase 2 family uncharacterized protein YibQ
MKLQLVTIGAGEIRGEFAGERQTAAVAEGRADEADVRPALAAHQTVARRRALVVAKLADRGIQQVQAMGNDAGHGVEFIPLAAGGKYNY